MVKVADGTSGARGFGAWRGRLLLIAGGFAAIANACGGRTVWVEEIAEAGESGSGGVSGYGGDKGGAGYAGDYGGGGFAGDYGGGGVSGAYGGTYGGYGGVTTGGFAGDYGGGGFTGGTAGYSGSGGLPTGGFAGSVGGYGGTAGMAGCGAASGSGGSAGSPSLGKACSYFCSRYPHQSCPSDWNDPGECIAQCQSGFGLDSWCHYALTDLLICMGSALNPGAACMVASDGQCYGPGCTVDAVNQCAAQLQTLQSCINSPRPLPPCPPPPPRPLPPNCGQVGYGGPDHCSRETWCPMQNYLTECYPQYDVNQTWYCDCYLNGVYMDSVTTDWFPDPCQAGAALCGYY